MVTRLLVMRRAVMLRAMMMRMMTTLLSRREVLLHHRPAVLVPHELLVGHGVALADRPL
jgi:hypothetical protein